MMMKNNNNAPRVSYEEQEHKKESRRQRTAKHLAAFSSQGYNLLGASVFMQPGILPKAVGVGLALKGSADYLKAYDMEPVFAKGPRERARQRFDQFSEAWANDDGTSLKDRMKRHVGKDIGDLKDKEFKMRFNRMMGGMAMAMAGLEINLSAGSNTQRIAGTAIMAVGITEQLHNTQKVSERSGEIHQSAQPAVQANLYPEA